MGRRWACQCPATTVAGGHFAFDDEHGSCGCQSTDILFTGKVTCVGVMISSTIHLSPTTVGTFRSLGPET